MRMRDPSPLACSEARGLRPAPCPPFVSPCTCATATGYSVWACTCPYMHLASLLNYSSVAASHPLAAPLPDSVLTLVNLSG